MMFFFFDFQFVIVTGSLGNVFLIRNFINRQEMDFVVLIVMIILMVFIARGVRQDFIDREKGIVVYFVIVILKVVGKKGERKSERESWGRWGRREGEREVEVSRRLTFRVNENLLDIGFFSNFNLKGNLFCFSLGGRNQLGFLGYVGLNFSIKRYMIFFFGR